MRSKKICEFFTPNSITIRIILNVIIKTYVLITVIDAKQLDANQNSKLKEIAIDFGFGSPVVDCLAEISEDSVNCVQKVTHRWNKLKTENNRLRVCCEKWDEYDCVIEAAADKCRYDGFNAVYESQQLIKQLLEADACDSFKYGSMDCVDFNPANNGKIGSIIINHNFYIVLIILLVFAFLFWLR